MKMADRYGINRTARALRLDYYSLKKRIEQKTAVASGDRQGSAVATFLEVAPLPSDVTGECTLELEDAGGAKMRIHLNGCEAPDLTALSRSFWGVPS